MPPQRAPDKTAEGRQFTKYGQGRQAEAPGLQRSTCLVPTVRRRHNPRRVSLGVIVSTPSDRSSSASMTE